jgi:hypothetical protein
MPMSRNQVCGADGSPTIIVSNSVFVVGEIIGSGGKLFDGSYHGSFATAPSSPASGLPTRGATATRRGRVRAAHRPTHQVVSTIDGGAASVG